MTRWEYEMNSELKELEKELVEANGEFDPTIAQELRKEVTFPYTHSVGIEMESRFDESVWDTLIGIFFLLIEKNRKYGDSALNPARIFSKASNIEQLKVRLDDKLSRIKNAQDDEDEDVIADLIGYLVLLTIARESL